MANGGITGELKALYSHRQKKLDTSLNRHKMKSIKDKIYLKIGSKAETHKNYFGVNNTMIGPLLQFLHQFIAKQPENQSCK